MQEFEICYGLSELPSNAVVTYRKAAKAVIEKDGKLLLIYTNQGLSLIHISEPTRPY